MVAVNDTLPLAQEIASKKHYKAYSYVLQPKALSSELALDIEINSARKGMGSPDSAVGLTASVVNKF